MTAGGLQIKKLSPKQHLPVKTMPGQRSRPLQQGQVIGYLLVVAYQNPAALEQRTQGPSTTQRCAGWRS